MRSRATLGMANRQRAGARAERDKTRATRSGAPPIAENSIAASIRRAAIDLLARREHSAAELRDRLQRKFGAESPVDTELERLAAERLLDDARFAEAFVRMHRQRGHGPLRILHELAQRGVDATLAESIVEPRSREWVELASRWRTRRFGEALPTVAKEWQRQARQLQSRGFSTEQVRATLREPRD